MSAATALGATVDRNGGCRFRVWAPLVERVELHLMGPGERLVAMERGERGYHALHIEGAEAGPLYRFRLDGKQDRPDPASRFQPQGVHGPSQVIETDDNWTDQAWRGPSLSEYVIYELHVGTFTEAGTFEAVCDHLAYLSDLGVTAVELMPVAQFPGSRNWGYDGVYPYAAQNSYGGPSGLKRLVDACHGHGLAVVLDVVYNHLGPEGNYLGDFGPYFTDRYKTPWGKALNFDGPQSDEVRRYFIENALYWITDCHIDALRLDAVHAIVDHTAKPFLEELAEAVHKRTSQLDRRIYTIAETAGNDPRIVQPASAGGFGHDAQWNDDFHHALHCVITGESAGYYQDYGRLEHLAKAFREGYVYTGEYSRFRRHRFGRSSRELPASKFVVCAQNHDQIGNRVKGDRLSTLVPFEAQKLAAGAVVLSPYIPLVFMGEEYGETAPFQYFVSHSDPDLIEAVRRGRREEFAAFHAKGSAPDPQDEGVFHRSRLDHTLREKGDHRALLAFWHELLRLRRTAPALAGLDNQQMEVRVREEEKVLCMRRWSAAGEAVTVFNFGEVPAAVEFPVPPASWHKQLDSADERWRGPGSSVPDRIRSQGSVTLPVNGKALVLFSREDSP